MVQSSDEWPDLHRLTSALAYIYRALDRQPDLLTSSRLTSQLRSFHMSSQPLPT